MHTVYKNVDKIIPYEKPPRINNAAFEAVANSVSGFVFRQPPAVAAITWSRDSAKVQYFMPNLTVRLLQEHVTIDNGLTAEGLCGHCFQCSLP